MSLVNSQKLSFVILNICRKWLVTMKIVTVEKSNGK